MARPREFDIDTAIDAAMSVFWTNGYEGASLPDLLDGTGLSRGSFYKAFASKQQLFLKALAHYADLEVWPAVDQLKTESDLTGYDRIDRVFASVAASVQAGDTRGCLLCSAAVSHAAQDPDIAGSITELVDAMVNGFAHALALERVTDTGLPHMLMTHYVGLRTLQRAGVKSAEFQAGIKRFTSALR